MTNASQLKIPKKSGARSAGIFVAAAALIAIGFFTLFSHMFAEGFAYLPGDFGDARLVNLLLEHNYRLFFQLNDQTFWNSSGNSFWSPTWMFFPLSNALAMSEVMTGSSWIYAIFRWSDFDYQTSFQLWILSCAALNFLATAWLFRSVGLSIIATLAGAWLFAFAMPRAGFLTHPQLMPGFYSPLACLMLWKYTQTLKPKCEFWSLALFSLFAALQIWSCIYLGWFLGFFLSVGTFVLFAKKSTRPLLIDKIRRSWKPILVAGILLAILIGPLALKLLATGQKYGPRGWMDVTMYLPEFYLFLLPHENSLLYHWLFEITPRGVKYLYEKLIFPGFIVFFAPFVLLRIYRKKSDQLFTRLPVNRIILWLAPAMVLLMFLLTLKIKNTESLWRIPYMFFPGAKGLRTAGRLILLTLLPMGFSFGALLDYLRAGLKPKTGVVAAIAMFGFVILENTVLQTYAYKKTEHEGKIAGLTEWLQDHRNQCDAFYYFSDTPTPITQIDAMWASFLTDVPTLNAHSGVSPKDYKLAGLDDAVATTMTSAQTWIALHSAAPVRLCLIDKGKIGLSSN